MSIAQVIPHLVFEASKRSFSTRGFSFRPSSSAIWRAYQVSSSKGSSWAETGETLDKEQCDKVPMTYKSLVLRGMNVTKAVLLLTPFTPLFVDRGSLGATPHGAGPESGHGATGLLKQSAMDRPRSLIPGNTGSVSVSSSIGDVRTGKWIMRRLLRREEKRDMAPC